MLDLTGNNNEAWYDVVDDTPAVEDHHYAQSAGPPSAAGHKQVADEQLYPQQQQQHSRQRLTTTTPAASGDGPQEAELGLVWYSTGSTGVERLWSARMSSGGAAMYAWGSPAGEPFSSQVLMDTMALVTALDTVYLNQPLWQTCVQFWPCSSCSHTMHCYVAVLPCTGAAPVWLPPPQLGGSMAARTDAPSDKFRCTASCARHWCAHPVASTPCMPCHDTWQAGRAWCMHG